jgi:Tfp pilus assembly protein PilX
MFDSLKNQKGVSLIITFFIMVIILSVVLMTSILLYSEIKITRNIGNSIIAYYSAESGLEKVFYYDRKVIPSGSTRGLCVMLDSVNNPNYCQTDPGGNVEHNLYCNNSNPNPGLPLGTNGCNKNVCNNCEVDFTTTISGSDNTYSVKATVTPNGTNASITDLSINSTGKNRSTNRAIQVFSSQ